MNRGQTDIMIIEQKNRGTIVVFSLKSNPQLYVYLFPKFSEGYSTDCIMLRLIDPSTAELVKCCSVRRQTWQGISPPRGSAGDQWLIPSHAAPESPPSGGERVPGWGWCYHRRHPEAGWPTGWGTRFILQPHTSYKHLHLARCAETKVW